MKKEFDISITGRVQTVMFRDFALRKARILGVLGKARNMRDGSVHVIAQGTENILNKYVELLKKGSKLSKVNSVDVKENKILKEYKDFNIIF